MDSKNNFRLRPALWGTPHQAKFCVDSTGKAQNKVRVTGPHGSPGFWTVLTPKAGRWQDHTGMSDSLSSALLAHPESRSLPGRDDPETRWVVWTREAEMKIQSVPLSTQGPYRGLSTFTLKQSCLSLAFPGLSPLIPCEAGNLCQLELMAVLSMLQLWNVLEFRSVMKPSPVAERNSLPPERP